MNIMTADPHSNILERLTSLWNTPVDARQWDAPPVRLYRNRTVSAAVIYRTLLLEFREPHIRAAISEFLTSIATKYELEAIPDKDEQFLTGCCIELTSQPEGIRVDKELVQRIVRVFPTSIWYNSVDKLVARYLTRSELLRALLEGIVRPANRNVVTNCLSALCLYIGNAQMDLESHTIAGVREALMEKVSELSRADDAETAQVAKLATRQLDIWQQEQPPPPS